MSSFRKIFFEACLRCTAWTSRRRSRSRISGCCKRTTPYHRKSTPRQSPSSVSCLTRSHSSSFTFHLCTTVYAEDDGDSIAIYSGSNGIVATDPSGWTIVEVVLIRTANEYTPSGYFPTYSNSQGYTIGFDAAVCVQKYESWIIEASNTSAASPSVLRVVGRGDGSVSMPPSGTIRGAPLPNIRYLNATEKDNPFHIGYRSGTDQLKSDNARVRHRYSPTPAVGPPCTPGRRLF